MDRQIKPELVTDIVIDEPKIRADEIINSLDVSENTRREYRYRIQLFLKYLSTVPFTRDSFRSFKRTLEIRNDLSVASKSKYLAVTRVFLKELARSGVLPVDITTNTKDFKKSRRHTRQGLNKIEINKVYSHLQALPHSKESARIKAMYFLFVHQGLRAIEVSRLDISDINTAAATMLIRGKGADGKELVQIDPMALEALKAYITAANAKSGPLFSSFGNRSKDRLSTTHIQRLFRDIFRSLGINKTLHGTRHFFVTNLLTNGLDIRDVQKFSRHSQISTVTIYDDEQDISRKSERVFEINQSLYAA